VRYVRVRISGPNADSPVTTLAATPEIEQVRLLAGGVADSETPTYTLSVRGSETRVREVLEESADVLAWEIVGSEAGLAYVYVQFEAPPQVGWLRKQLTRDSLVVLLPATFHADSVELTVVGTQADLSTAFETFPRGIETTILEVGTYQDSIHQGYSLTDRQRTVLKTAYEMGYYDQPRNTSHQAIANELDCAPSTVGEHLQKAEKQLVGAVFD
jgi:Predicted DNA binding protein